MKILSHPISPHLTPLCGVVLALTSGVSRVACLRVRHQAEQQRLILRSCLPPQSPSITCSLLLHLETRSEHESDGVIDDRRKRTVKSLT